MELRRRSAPPARRPALVAAAAVGSSSLAGGLWLARRAAPAAGPSASVAAGRRVAVLPFRDLSGTPSGALIGEGFAETVSTLLASGGGVAVLPSGGASRA